MEARLLPYHTDRVPIFRRFWNKWYILLAALIFLRQAVRALRVILGMALELLDAMLVFVQVL